MSEVDRVAVAVRQIRQVPEGYSLEDVVRELDAQQQAALEALIATGKGKLAAEAAGVHRNTVRRWMNSDPFFKAAYNASIQETREAVRGRLNAIAERAAMNVEKAVEEGDRKMSYQLLKDLGHIDRRAADVATDPGIIQAQMENEFHRQGGRQELADAVTVGALLLRARQADKRRRRERLLAASAAPPSPQ